MVSALPLDPGISRDRIRVLLVDDHVLLRQALGFAVQTSGYCEVVGYAGDGREAVAMVLDLHPDVVLMDMVMPGLNGVEATRQIVKRAPSAHVLVLSAYSDDARVADALDAGALGFLSKSTDREELVRAIRVVSSGNRYMATDGVTNIEKTRTRRDGGNLTEREREVLQLIAEGRSNRQIADELVLSVKTIESHRAGLMKKLSALSRADLVRFAIDNRIAGFEVLPPDLIP
jgi:two-component system response regulator NreC